MKKEVDTDKKKPRGFRSWKIRDPDDEPALPHAIVLELKKKYGLDEAVADKLWTDIECALLPDIREEPKGENERSKIRAQKILKSLEDKVSSARKSLNNANMMLADIYFIDPIAGPAEDNPYVRFAAQLEALSIETARLEEVLIDLSRNGFQPIFNGVADASYRFDVRRQRVSWAVFEALIMSGCRVAWTYSPTTEVVESVALEFVNEIAEHIMDPYEAFSGPTIKKDWQDWNADPSGQQALERARQITPRY